MFCARRTSLSFVLCKTDISCSFVLCKTDISCSFVLCKTDISCSFVLCKTDISCSFRGAENYPSTFLDQSAVGKLTELQFSWQLHYVFWVITQRAVTISYRRFGTNYRSHLCAHWKRRNDKANQYARINSLVSKDGYALYTRIVISVCGRAAGRAGVSCNISSEK